MSSVTPADIMMFSTVAGPIRGTQVLLSAIPNPICPACKALRMACITTTPIVRLGSPVHLLPIGPEGLSLSGSLKVIRKSSGMSRLQGGLYSQVSEVSSSEVSGSYLISSEVHRPRPKMKPPSTWPRSIRGLGGIQ